ncbi:MAG: glycosyltransferase family 2 protein [Acidimicrobiia bacterium]
MTPARTASIIIRTKNEERGIAATLDGVFAQSVPPHEVIVVDSGSVDRTLAIAQRYPVRVVHLPPQQWGYGRALNVGAAAATGEILVCLSAHCPAASIDWLASLLRHFDDPTVAGVWGPGIRPGRPLPQPEPPSRQEPGSYDPHNRLWGLSNGNSALRRSLWQEFAFDEALPAAEDKAWGREALARGYCIVHDPAAVVWHERHGVLAAYRRERAVNEGFAIMFPDVHLSRSVVLARVRSPALRWLSRHLSMRDGRALWHDVRLLPSTIAALIGALVVRRRVRSRGGSRGGTGRPRTRGRTRRR